MEEQTIGRLEPVLLRELWETEAQDFTPWLAEERNISLLGDTLQLDLEVQAQEKEVGPFRADILCKDTANNAWVLIENQLERTDHTHLGQLMTYAAGLDAVTIVWLASRFTEEHRAALDWLNRITEEGISFFGLEIELWRIGSSPIAPKFNIVARPNDWSKTVKTDAKKGQLSETQNMQLEYWTQFREFMQGSGTPLRCQKPQPCNWTSFAIGRAYFTLVAKINSQAKEGAVFLCISGAEKEAHFNLLKTHYREQVEGQMQYDLEWRELPEAKESQIVVHLNNADPSDREDWPKQHKWLKAVLEKFNGVFRPIVKELDASEYHESLNPGEEDPSQSA